MIRSRQLLAIYGHEDRTVRVEPGVDDRLDVRYIIGRQKEYANVRIRAIEVWNWIPRVSIRPNVTEGRTSLC
jgi:hypothetical protein